MSDSKDVKFNFKAVINKEKTKVLFAEVENDFVNMLFSFLILPLGKIMQVFEKHYGDKTPDHVIGSLNTLYNGFANLGGCLFQSNIGYKPDVLNSLNVMGYAFPHPHVKVYFQHSNYYSLGNAYFVVYKVFTKDEASFLICDDLRIAPNANAIGSIAQTLNSVGLDMADMDGSEIRNVTFGLNQIMDFLKGLMISHQPLTDSILGASSTKSGILSHRIHEEATANSEKMILKAMFQKSTNKFIFAQAGEDFVSFLFSMIRTPLGLGDLHMGGNLVTLYRSIVDIVDSRYIQKGYSKDHLMKPEAVLDNRFFLSVDVILNSDRSRIYMVTDDLTVRHLHVSSAFSLLNQMKISSSDVEEVELNIGQEEARNILKASLTSTRAFTDGLSGVVFNIKQKKLKQEHC